MQRLQSVGASFCVLSQGLEPLSDGEQEDPRAKATWDFPLASVKFVQPEPEIFHRRELATATTLIIVEPVLNWCGINDFLHKLIAV